MVCLLPLRIPYTDFHANLARSSRGTIHRSWALGRTCFPAADNSSAAASRGRKQTVHVDTLSHRGSDHAIRDAGCQHGRPLVNCLRAHPDSGRKRYYGPKSVYGEGFLHGNDCKHAYRYMQACFCSMLVS